MENICPFTWEGWVRGTAGRISSQLAGGGNTGQNKWLLYIPDGGKPVAEVWSGGGCQKAHSYVSINDGAWQYLMFTFDFANDLKLYVDNELVAETVTAGNWSTTGTTLEIGSGEGIYRFNGSIDELRISNIVRVPMAQELEPPSLKLDVTYPDPLAPWYVQADVDWCNAQNTWQVLDWGDGSATEIYGPCGSATRYHDYAEGAYNLSFNVFDLGSNTHTKSEPIYVVVGCGDDVTMDGVVLFDGQDCIGTYVQFTGLGIYKLTTLNDQTTSLHLPSDYSVMLFENLDGSGQGFCAG